jgi:putative oxidoreductase
MTVAYFMAHAPGSLYSITNHGELAVVLCFVVLYPAIAGRGKLSVDAVWRE